MSDCIKIPLYSGTVGHSCDAESLSPEEFINCLINKMQEFADSLSRSAINTSNYGISKVEGADWSIARKENQYVMEAEEPDIPEVDNVKVIYDGEIADLLPLIQSLYDEFFDSDDNTIFNPARDAAGGWLYDVIENGKLGIPEELEARIWARERYRLLAQVATTKKTVSEQFAAKGWRVAGGVVTAGMNAAEISAHRPIGESSTRVATFQAEETLKSVRFAVEQALKVYQAMLGAATDWIAAIIRAMDHALKLSEVDPNVKANLINATSNLFRARINKDAVQSGSFSQFYNRVVNDVELHSKNEIGKLGLSVEAINSASNVMKGLGMATQSQFSGIVSSAVSG